VDDTLCKFGFEVIQPSETYQMSDEKFTTIRPSAVKPRPVLLLLYCNEEHCHPDLLLQQPTGRVQLTVDQQQEHTLFLTPLLIIAFGVWHTTVHVLW
jgi:hypothetical protein